MIGVVDLKMGNLRSVMNAVDQLGYDVGVANAENNWESFSHLILPGVGHFYAAMQNLQLFGLIEKINLFVKNNKPLLGICLGMQLFAEYGEEGQGANGLALLPGKVLHFPQSNLLIPHVGWNELDISINHPVFDGIKNKVDFYFVHSYCYDGLHPEIVLGKTQYGIRFPSVVGSGNVVGVQFHPEKSQKNGLRLLENFCQWDGQC